MGKKLANVFLWHIPVTKELDEAVEKALLQQVKYGIKPSKSDFIRNLVYEKLKEMRIKK
jgi:Arc/MetJ-type ribon-helix-helix transcriptional regulator